MYNHAPKDYKCPICAGLQGVESNDTLIKKDDIIYKDELVTALINSFSIGNNPGHVIIVPNKHVENFYDLDPSTGQKILELAKKIALAMKATYHCDGITILQNNEPAGDQHAFHYHLHIFPRYSEDDFKSQQIAKHLASPAERKKYASLLKPEIEK